MLTVKTVIGSRERTYYTTYEDYRSLYKKGSSLVRFCRRYGIKGRFRVNKGTARLLWFYYRPGSNVARMSMVTKYGNIDFIEY